MQIEFSSVVQEVADRTGEEVTAGQIRQLFDREYLNRDAPLALVDYRLGAAPQSAQTLSCRAEIRENGVSRTIEGQGNGPIDAFVHALVQGCGVAVEFLDYQEHAVGHGSDVQAVCFVEIADPTGRKTFGAGLDANTTTASFKATGERDQPVESLNEAARGETAIKSPTTFVIFTASIRQARRPALLRGGA